MKVGVGLENSLVGPILSLMLAPVLVRQST
jgi:hypothetical protein